MREFLKEAFGYAGLDWHAYVQEDPRYLRPSEVDYLIGDPSKARQTFGWAPKTGFRDLVRIMVDADRLKLRRKLAGGKEAATA